MLGQPLFRSEISLKKEEPYSRISHSVVETPVKRARNFGGGGLWGFRWLSVGEGGGFSKFCFSLYEIYFKIPTTTMGASYSCKMNLVIALWGSVDVVVLICLQKRERF